MKVLFVCAGNTCRSPMAEAMLRSMAAERGLDVEAASAGIAPWPGDVAAADTVAILKEQGIDIEGRRALQLNEDMIAGSDLVLTMTDMMADVLRQNYPDEVAKIRPLGTFCGFDEEVEDPYGGDRAIYQKTYDQLVRLLGALLDRLA